MKRKKVLLIGDSIRMGYDIDKVIPYTDVFLYDIKAYDEDVHIKCTGYRTGRYLKISTI
jgi:pyruvate-formate lyase-activating enzyme